MPDVNSNTIGLNGGPRVMSTPTSNFGLSLPDVGGSFNVWGNGTSQGKPDGLNKSLELLDDYAFDRHRGGTIDADITITSNPGSDPDPGFLPSIPTASGHLTLQNGDLSVVAGNATIGGTLGVTGDATMGGTLDVTGDATMGGALDVTGDVTMASVRPENYLIYSGTGAYNYLRTGDAGTALAIQRGTTNMLVLSSTGAVVTGALSGATSLTTSGHVSLGGELNMTGTGDKYMDVGDINSRLFIRRATTAMAVFDSSGVGVVGTLSADEMFSGGNILADGSVSVDGNVTINSATSSGAGLIINSGAPGTYAGRLYHDSNKFVIGHATAGGQELSLDSAGTVRLAAGNIVVATGTSGSIWTYGVWNNQATNSNANVRIDSGGLLRRTASAGKYKKDIAELSADSGAIIDALRPVTFKMKAGDGKVEAGFIAEEVAEVYALAEDEENYNDRAIIALLVKEVQNLRAQIGAS